MLLTKLKSRLFEYGGLPGQIIPRERRMYEAMHVVSLFGCIFHFIFIFFFFLLGIKALAYFNIISVLAWITVNRLNKKSHIRIAFVLVEMELAAHAVMAVHFTGWHFGFQYYLIIATTGIAMLPQGNKMLKSGLLLFACSLFIGLYYYAMQRGFVWTGSVPVMALTNMANITATFFLIVVPIHYFRNATDKAEAALELEHRKVENLLHNILPVSIATRLKENAQTIADGFKTVTVLFADIAGFTRLSENISPEKLVGILNNIFSRFDALSDHYGLEKIKTIGDAYMVAAGIPEERDDHAEVMADFALGMLAEIADYNTEHAMNLSIRVGISSGPVVAGIIGKKKFSYDLWGDSVNTASRMESHGEPGAIQVTQDTYDLLKNKYDFTDRGNISVKGKGNLHTYFLTGKLFFH
jgi:class 3 adenylate cyclase